MSESPFDEALDPDASDQDQPGDEDRQALAEHDRLGVDLAVAIAHAAVHSAPAAGAQPVQLPPARGVDRRQRRVRGPAPVTFSGAGPDARDPQPLASALQSMIRQRGWARQHSVQTLLLQWSELVGPVNAQHSRPESFREKVVTVRTDSTTWANQLRLLAPQVVAEMNRQLGQGTVASIKVLGPQAPSWKHGPRTVEGRGPRDTYG